MQLEEQVKKFNINNENDKRLFLSAYTTLKSIFDCNSHHLLIYSNNKENSIKLIDYIKILINDNYFDIPNLYFKNYISDMKTKEQTNIIDEFQKAQFGIITCVYCLGEGAKALATALEKNTTIRGLNLYANNIGKEGIDALTSVLEKNKIPLRLIDTREQRL